MGLTRCYKTEGFYIYICSFSAIFYAISISDTCLRSRKTISIPNFNKIYQSKAEIWLLLVSETNGRHSGILLPVYMFSYWRCLLIGMSFCICLPDLVVIGRSAAELWRHIRF